MRNHAFLTQPGAAQAGSNGTTQLIDAVSRAPLEHQPFEYLFMPEAFAPDLYREMQAQLPDKRHFHPLRHKDAMRPDGTSTRLRMYLYPELLWRLPVQQRAVWAEVSRTLLARELQETFVRRFAHSLEKRFGVPAHALSFFPVPILLCDLPGYRIGIHADALSKAITVQFYLPRDASRSHLGTVFHDGRDGDAAARTRRLPYLPASGYAFPVMPEASWHSVPQTVEADGDRYSLMLTYYVQNTLGTWLKRRYNRARCFVGAGPKG